MVFLVNVVNQWVIVVNQRVLVVSLWRLSRARPRRRDAVAVQIVVEPANCAPHPWQGLSLATRMVTTDESSGGERAGARRIA